MEYLAVILSALACLLSAAALVAVLTKKQKSNADEIKRIVSEQSRADGEALDSKLKYILTAQGEANRTLSENQSASMETLRKTVSDLSNSMEGRFKTFSESNEKSLNAIKENTEKSIDGMKKENEAKLNEIKIVVDEKLQKTLNERFAQSFNTVSERLEAVQKGLGEMQSLASNVGDLKNALLNVKTSGNMGEIQLESILTEILPQKLWEKQFAVSKGSLDRVDFVIKLPGSANVPVYLPIDSKFPVITYNSLLAAYETGDKAAVDAARKELARALKAQAKSIKEKYIEPPVTTDFAIMFLPSEGLYAEAAKSELIETLMHDYKINVCGPSTVAALLNSLQMGFSTLEIQKRSSEVWGILGAVKTEFDKFGGLLEKTQKKLDDASKDLDTLIGTRSRMIRSKLRGVSALDEGESKRLLDITPDSDVEEE
ncbi:MAG: DNA recombination protein RmuC [Clostridia bacterium]|nr:DNA recombination protein RmuC [Clostridia bacterium]